jgi:uncharacterized membrane protein YczE
MADTMYSIKRWSALWLLTLLCLAVGITLLSAAVTPDLDAKLSRGPRSSICWPG